MFARLSLLSVLGLVLVAAAHPSPSTKRTGQCNTGKLNCCDTVGKSDDPSISKQLGLLGVVLQGLSVPVGLSCDPIDLIGVGDGSNCAQQPACCTGDVQNGLVNLGCTPINAGL
ncbi:hydrophobin-like protein [Heterobasidion irregulare TC 32-1]|uniref:Hydrophobin n=1 Tax=Heterobasidion irregulare (strain TC 32-1) TaxID=747525 RepID=W4JUQ3_HETIT|nr:hydrophobin-like protein [Heterobasidion irregulare TC 32-1]ETW76631.1 hydrophobin-like protein [Heterobasidion irregulare TC 32-1]